jgi:hypothetical protein
MLSPIVLHAKGLVTQEIVNIRRIATRKVLGIFPGLAAGLDGFVRTLPELGLGENALDSSLKPGEGALKVLWKTGGGENGKMLCSHVSLQARFIWLGSAGCW